MSLKGNKGLLTVYEHPVKRSFYQLTPLPLAQHWNSFFHVMSIVLMNYCYFTVEFLWTIFQCDCCCSGVQKVDGAIHRINHYPVVKD